MATIPKDWVEAYFDYGIDKENRRIFLVSDIEDKPISNVIKGIYYLDSLDHKKPIELFIGSFGGSEYEMFALYDVLNTTTCPVHTVALGKCMSAAPLLVAAGDHGQRYSMPNTQWMIHQGWDNIGEKRYDEIEIDVKHYNKISERWAKLMEKHSKITAKKWLIMCKRPGDRYFNADEAIEMGLVDHIWSEKD